MSECPSRGACAIAHLATFAAVRDLNEERCGLRFDASQRASLSAAVAARMQELGLERDEEYVERLRGDAPRIVEAELRNLLNLVTITETCFFRDDSQFRLLREHIIPSLIAARREEAARPIRIWSAGCSSGEEAYSVAITLDAMGVYETCPDLTFEIIGTDINNNALERARRGLYTARAVRQVHGRVLEKYFVRDGNTFELCSAIRRRVTFEFGNITQTPMPSGGVQDVIFCKNVAIYFSADVTRRLIQGLHDALAPGGVLLLGHAESLWQVSDQFTLVEYDRLFCYRKSRPTLTVEPSAAAPLKAEAPVRAVARQSVPDGSAQYDACLSAFRAGDWTAAEAGLSALVLSCPTFVPALLLLGGLHAHRGRFDEALAQAENVLTVNDLEARAHLLCGMVAARQRRSEDALQSLRRALYLDDSLGLAHLWLGDLFRDRGDMARARQEYENVIRGWEQHTLDLTEEFAQDLSAEQIVDYCRQSARSTHG